MTLYNFDVICIGGGPAGMAFSTRAALLGKKVALIEYQDIGGTCLNRGCIPKKLMFYAGKHISNLKEIKGVSVNTDTIKVDWSIIQSDIDDQISNIRSRLELRLNNDNVFVIKDKGKLQINSNNEPEVILENSGKKIQAPHIVLCGGGLPTVNTIANHHLALTSDDFLKLKYLPKKAIILGSGYTACEFANIWRNAGVDVTVIYRSELIKRFDTSIIKTVKNNLKSIGIKLINSSFNAIEKINNGYAVLNDDSLIAQAECILSAVGRNPNDSSYANSIGIKLNSQGKIIVNNQLQTSIGNVYALGDISESELDLAPTAIWQGRKLAKYLYGKSDTKNFKYADVSVPSAVFCSPEAAAVGLTEEEARKNHSNDLIKVFKAEFRSLKQSYFRDNVKSMLKIICLGEDERIIGIHLVADNASEMMQCLAFGISAKMTRLDLIRSMPLHPTLTEELIFMSK